MTLSSSSWLLLASTSEEASGGFWPWEALKSGLTSTLEFLHGVLQPLFGDAAWGWAIIALTLVVRLLMMPLAIKQTRSMRGMQAIQPKVKKLQEKYKVDRDLLKKDPETYQRRKQEMNEKLMELYKEEGVNPASSCLPLLLQMPIFFALFRIFGADGEPALQEATTTFYFFTPDGVNLGDAASAAGWAGYLLILLMAGSMFITQRQMMARSQVEGPAATQQKIMMYFFPVFLAFISRNFALALLLYWVTTNLWQMAQQYVILRTVSHEVADDAAGEPKHHHPHRKGHGGDRPPTGSSSGTPKTDRKPTKGGQNGAGSQGSHLPKGRKGR